MSGQTAYRADIAAISNANPCVVTTTEANSYATNRFIRLTDLNGVMPTPRGEDQLNNKKFRIIVIDTTNFSLQDPITFKNIDSTNYTPYVEAGYANLVQTEFIYN